MILKGMYVILHLKQSMDTTAILRGVVSGVEEVGKETFLIFDDGSLSVPISNIAYLEVKMLNQEQRSIVEQLEETSSNLIELPTDIQQITSSPTLQTGGSNIESKYSAKIREVKQQRRVSFRAGNMELT